MELMLTVPLTVETTVGTGAAPVLTAVWPTDSEATTLLLAEVVACFGAPFTVEKAAARNAALTTKPDSIWVTFMLKSCSKTKKTNGASKS